MTAAELTSHPLVQASGGKITAQKLADYYNKNGSFPVWRAGPDGQAIISSAKNAKALGYTNPGQITSVAGTTASKAATSGQPGTGVGSVYTPAAVQQALKTQTSNMQGATQAGQQQILADLYQNTGTTGMMAKAAQGAASGVNPPITTSPPTPGIGLPGDPRSAPLPGPTPPRGRGAQIPEGTTVLGGSVPGYGTSPVPAISAGSFSTPQQFADWFSNQGPRMAGDLGSIYNMPAPVMTPSGEYQMPGLVGQTFGSGGGNALLGERVQAQQLLNNRAGQPTDLYGPISPLMPPHLVQQAGFGPESVLGGKYSLGQVANADPSLQGVVNQGALDWYNGQTPTGPFAGFQFPQHFGQNQGGATTNLPAGSSTNFNPWAGFGQPGTNPPPGGGTFNPIPGSGGGSTGGGSAPGGGGTFNPNPFPPATGGGGTGGGTGGGAGGSNPFPPISIDTGTTSGGIGAPSSADAFLADTTNDLGYLRGIASNAGYATDSTPAWEAMIAAQQRNIDRNAALLGEKFNVSGNRFSSVFGDAMTDYYSQTGLDQNSLLAQMTLAAQEAARGRELQAAGQLGQFGYGAGSQLSNQGFQAQMQAGQQAYGASQNMYNASQQAAMQLLANSMAGAQGLFGAENQAGLAEAQRQQQLLQLMLGTGLNLSQDWQQNLLTGSQLGGQQYTIEQDQINRLVNEFLRTQPEASPWLPYLFSGATGYPPTAYPQYTPNYTGDLLSGIGGILGMGGGMQQLLSLFGGGGGGGALPDWARNGG